MNKETPNHFDEYFNEDDEWEKTYIKPKDINVVNYLLETNNYIYYEAYDYDYNYDKRIFRNKIKKEKYCDKCGGKLKDE